MDILSLRNPNVWLDIGVDDEYLGRVELCLYDARAPNTCHNFRSLILGTYSTDRNSLHYRGSIFHRIVPGVLIQGGDFERGNGSGGRSIFGKPFADENLDAKHKHLYTLAMANYGPNTNTSQFYITCGVKASWLNGKHVVFGHVVKGEEVVHAVEQFGSVDDGNGQKYAGKPTKFVTILDCGIVER